MKNLSYWLRKTPQPVTVLADDKKIPVPRNGRAWRDLTATIQAMEPSKLTCLDEAGNVIRSIALEHESEEAGGDDKIVDPDMANLQLFAKLLAEAWDKAGNRMQPIVDSAMAFVERGGTRLAKLETENDRLRAIIHKLNAQISELASEPVPAAGEDSIMGALVAGIAQGQMAQQSAPAPTPITAAQKGPKK